MKDVTDVCGSVRHFEIIVILHTSEFHHVMLFCRPGGARKYQRSRYYFLVVEINDIFHFESDFEFTARPHGTRPHGTLFSQIHYFGLGTKISKIHCFLSSFITSRYTISKNV